VHPPPLINPSLCDEQGKKEASMSNSHNYFYEYELNRCEGAAFARQCIGLSLRYVWDAYSAGMAARAARAAQANRAECTNDGPANAALDSERKHSKRRKAAQAAEPATARGDASKDYKMGGFATRRFKGTKEIDEAAMAALAAAHSNGTDGLTDEAATHSLLQALAAAGDIYATMQQGRRPEPAVARAPARGPASTNAATLRPPPTPTAPQRRSRGATARGDALPRPLRQRADPHNVQGRARRQV